MQSITWALIGTSTFAVGWLAIAQTEEIVVAAGKLEPIGAVKDIQMPLGGIAEEILVQEGDRVSAGQALILLDGELTQKELESLEESITLKHEQLTLKETELNRYLQMNSEEAKMLESASASTRKFLVDLKHWRKKVPLQNCNTCNNATKLEKLKADSDKFRLTVFDKRQSWKAN